jgi:DNA polymerase III delta prime subunit
MAGDSQKQKYGDLELTNSSFESLQAGEDVIKAEQVTKIKQYYFSLFGDRTSEPTVDWDWAERAVLRPLYGEIGKRLKDSLFGLAEVDGIEVEAFPQNDSPFLALEAVKTVAVDGTEEKVDPQTPIIEVYARRDVNKKLLILGTPGAGKTITLLRLAEQLVGEAIAQPQTVIPIIFELSTWKEGQAIEDWLIEQLYESYGGNRKRKIYEYWLERRVLLPLLDGLDELGMLRQRACTVKVNEFAETYPYLVVCCRVKEFQQAGVNLANLRGKVQLQPLSNEQIQSYLGQSQKSGLWLQIQSVPEMSQLLKPVIDLEYPEYNEPGLLRVPLFISLAAQVYEADKPLKGKTDLFDRYIDRQLSLHVRTSDRRKEIKKRDWAFKTVKQEPRKEKAIYLLDWIAKRLQHENQVELMIEKVQPSWLTNSTARFQYTMLSGLFGLVAGILTGIKLGELFGALFFGLITLLFMLIRNFVPVVFSLARATTYLVLFSLFLLFLLKLGEKTENTVYEFLALIIGSIPALIFFLILLENDPTGLFGIIPLLVMACLAILSTSIPVSYEKQRDYLFRFLIIKVSMFCFALAFPLNFQASVTLFCMAICGLAGGFIFEIVFDMGKIKTVESFRIFMSKQVRQETLQGFSFWISSGLLFGLIIGLIVGNLIGFAEGILSGLIGGIIFGLNLGLVSGLVEGLTFGLSQDLRSRSRPNQGVWDSLQSFILTTLISFPFVIVLFAGITSLPIELSKAIITGQSLEVMIIVIQISLLQSIIPGVIGALLLGILIGGGKVVIQHPSLRLILTCHNKIPWNLAQFLTYCHERRLLQQIGGRYRFIHRELLDHFAGKAEG